MRVPLRARPLAAAAGLVKSTKQYPAFLVSISKENVANKEWEMVPRKFVADHLYANVLAHVEPDRLDKVLIDPRLKFAHPVFHCQRYSRQSPSTLVV